jgi:hypothetical protein
MVRRASRNRVLWLAVLCGCALAQVAGRGAAVAQDTVPPDPVPHPPAVSRAATTPSGTPLGGRPVFVLAPVPRPSAPRRSLRPVARGPWAVPELDWEDHPRNLEWTLATMSALRGHGAPLVETVPDDIDDWCPGYADAGEARRRAFWAGLISTLAWYESSHRPRAVGGGGQWFGLVQIAPGTARWRNCEATSASGLLDAAANLRCGLRIMAITVPRDGVISQGMEGVAADWGPFHSTRKREEMREWVRSRDYCRPSPVTAMRPPMRPVGADVSAEDASR